MPAPNITMTHYAGSAAVGTRVILRDGTFVIANASGQISVPRDFMTDLLHSGFSVAVTGGAGGVVP